MEPKLQEMLLPLIKITCDKASTFYDSITMNEKVHDQLLVNNERRDNAGVNGKLMAKGNRIKIQIFPFFPALPFRLGQGRVAGQP